MTSISFQRLRRIGTLSGLFFVTMSTSLALSFANAQEVKVTSRYEAKSLLANALLPFKVESSLLNGGRIDLVQAVSENGADCRAMKDPFLADHFLLKCDRAARAHLSIRIITPLKLYDVAYGPVNVVDAGAGLSPMTPAPMPTPTPAPDDALLGRQLYNAHCVRCHSPASVKKGRTFAQIKNAMNLNDMRSLQNQLTDDDLRKIAAYLQNP